jgi:hypothetical protein
MVTKYAPAAAGKKYRDTDIGGGVAGSGKEPREGI